MAIVNSIPARLKKSSSSWLAWLGLVPIILFGLAFELAAAPDHYPFQPDQ